MKAKTQKSARARALGVAKAEILGPIPPRQPEDVFEHVRGVLDLGEVEVAREIFIDYVRGLVRWERRLGGAIEEAGQSELQSKRAQRPRPASRSKGNPDAPELTLETARRFIANFEKEHGTRRGLKKAASRHFCVDPRTFNKVLQET